MMKKLSKHTKRRGAQPTKVLFSIEVVSLCNLLPSLSSIGDDALLSVCFERYRLTQILGRNVRAFNPFSFSRSNIFLFIILSLITKRRENVLLHWNTFRLLSWKRRYSVCRSDFVISSNALSGIKRRFPRENCEAYSSSIKGKGHHNRLLFCILLLFHYKPNLICRYNI